jgi:2-keto-4-pentenoate hydratase/2-oxohepta-3-ene-1,7-dioic acid hydratase in catechol pathway
MKLVRFGPRGEERPGIVVADGAIKDCSAVVSDYDHAFFATGGLDRLRAVADIRALPDAPAGVRLGAPVARPHNVFAIGLNYADHARETGAAIPAEPILFMKATTAVNGPHDPIRIPHGSTKTDWEVELGLVLGRGGQWSKGKSCPTVLPLGPWLVTPDEIGDPQALGLWLDVNGRRRQTGSTAWAANARCASRPDAGEPIIPPASLGPGHSMR